MGRRPKRAFGDRKTRTQKGKWKKACKNLVLPGGNASLSNHVKEKSDAQNILTIGVMCMLRRVMKQTQPWERNTAWSSIDFGFQAKLFDFSHDSHRVVEK